MSPTNKRMTGFRVNVGGKQEVEVRFGPGPLQLTMDLGKVRYRINVPPERDAKVESRAQEVLKELLNDYWSKAGRDA